jgi:hypothetical protein
MSDWQRIDWAKQGFGFALCNERGQVRSPSFELLGNSRQADFCVAEVDGVNPILRLVEGYIGVQRTVRIAVRQDALTRRDSHERAAADRIRAYFVTRVAI